MLQDYSSLLQAQQGNLRNTLRIISSSNQSSMKGDHRIPLIEMRSQSLPSFPSASPFAPPPVPSPLPLLPPFPQFIRYWHYMGLQLKFTSQWHRMRYSVTLHPELPCPSWTWEQDSLFCNSPSSGEQVSIQRIWINRRLIGAKNHWNRCQEQSYISFLKEQFELVEGEGNWQTNLRMYGLMAKSIGSKNYAQCRVHHRRMLARFGTAEAVIEAGQRRLRGAVRRWEKMQQYLGLQVGSEEGEQGEGKGEENEMWTVVEEECWSYYQKEAGREGQSIY